MKLNKKEETRTLHADPTEDGFILRERDRSYNPQTGRNQWYEQRIFISHDEVLKLTGHKATGGAA